MNYASTFILTAAVYALIGMLMGAFMHISQTYTIIPLHTHVSVLGWLSLAVVGLVYRHYEKLESDPLAPWHFWCAQIGILSMNGGLGLFYVTGIRIPLNIGVVLTPLSFLLFLWLFWRHRRE